MLKFGMLSLFLLGFSFSWVGLISSCMFVTFLWMILQSTYSVGSISWVMVDNYSFVLVMLSFWVTALMFMASYYINFNNKFPGLFSLMILMMLFFLLMSFSTSNFMMFYVMFEASLIPIFLLVLGWGYQPERVSASYYLLFYTLTASLPLLIGLISAYDYFCSLDYFIFFVESMVEPFTFSSPFFVILILAFMVKMPVYFFHLWLPKAHVEAPVAGSMILAGVLLKLGGYGLIRLFMFSEDNMLESFSWLTTLSIFGAILGSLICLRQTDVKSLVAYSSVAHMALVLMGLSMGSYISVAGAIIIMVAHGLCSSGLFSLVGMVYERVSSRSLLVLRSGLSMAPSLSLWWFLLSVANMAAPPTPNLAGEILIFISSLSFLGLLALVVGLASFFGAAFNLYMYSSTQHGNLMLGVSGMKDSLYREHQVLFFHVSSLLMSLFMLMNMFVC
nr:NADH dehydrogenase subunit 4 [Moina macrocopa]